MRRVRRCGLRVAFVAHTQEFRCSAVRTPLWATQCLRRIRMPKNFVALRCVRRCRPRIAVAAECRRISWLCSTCAAVGCALPGCFRMIGRTSLLCNRCGPRAVFVASDSPGFSFPLQCVRRCGLRIAAIAAHVPRPSLLCSAHAAAGCALSSSHPTVLAFCFLCGAHAAVGCALSSSHPTTQAFRLHCRVASDCPRPSLPCNA